MFDDYIKYVKLFGVKYGASEEEIREAYKKMAREYHPDKGGSEEKFKEISSGYEYLKNYGCLYTMSTKQKIMCFVLSVLVGILLLILFSSLVVISSAIVLFIACVLYFICLCALFYCLFVFGTEDEVIELKKIKNKDKNDRNSIYIR